MRRRLQGGDVNLSLLKRCGSAKRETRVLGALPCVGRDWRDIVLLKREVRVLGALPRVWWQLVSRYGPRILTDYYIYKKVAVFQESSLDSFLFCWTLVQEF